MAIPKAYQQNISPKAMAKQKVWKRTFVRYLFVFFIIGCASFMVGKKIFHYANYLKTLRSIDVPEPSSFSLSIGKKSHAQSQPAPAASTGTPAAPTMEKDPTQPNQAFDPLSISTEQEVKLLQNLAERRKNLDKREEDVIKKERLIEVSKKEVFEKLAELEKVKKAIESTLTQIDKAEKGRFDRLIKMYESMKPKEAAKIFNQMDVKMLRDLFMVMNEKKLSAIMATMNPLKAKEVTGTLITQKNAFATDEKTQTSAPSAAKKG